MIRLPLFFVVITEDAEHPSGEAVILACFSSGKISETVLRKLKSFASCQKFSEMLL